MPETFPQPSEENAFLADYVAILFDNFKHCTGKELIAPGNDICETAKAIWNAPFAVASHSADADPLFVYANRTALQLFEMDWRQLARTHSSQSAEPVHRTERIRMLERVHEKGYIDDYSGIRISTCGKRFYIENAIIWNLEDHHHQYIGQAAMFTNWEFID